MRLVFRGILQDSYSLTYRVEASAVRSFVPDAFDLVQSDRDAYWNVFISKIDAMRPAGLPRWCGVDFTIVSHRLLVHAISGTGSNLPGMYPIRTDADPLLARIFTDFPFHRSRFEWKTKQNDLMISVDASPSEEGNAFVRLTPERGALYPENISIPMNLLNWNPIQQHIQITEASIAEGTSIEKSVYVHEAHFNIFRELELNTSLQCATRIQASEYFVRTGHYVEPARMLTFI